MFRGSTGRWLRVAAATTLVMALAPLTAGAASATKTPQDQYPAEQNKITICHRTNSDTNPYVVITPAKDSIFKTRGHDSHDGPVYDSTLKAQGTKWGDIIPPFEYYASPQDQRTDTKSRYAGQNWSAEGQAIYRNGCDVPNSPPPGQQKPTGGFDLPCVPPNGAVVIFGELNDSHLKDVGVVYRLKVETDGSVVYVEVTERQLEAEGGYTVPAAGVGSTITLQYKVAGGDWTTLDGPKTVVSCAAPQGSYTVKCAASNTSAEAVMGTLDDGGDENGRFEFAVGTTVREVDSGARVTDIPLGSNLELAFVSSTGVRTVLGTQDAPAVCQTVQETPASGSFTTRCTETGALADVGTLSEGSFSGGSYFLVATGFERQVTSGEKNVTVPVSTTVRLEYRRSGAAPSTLDSEQSPAACPPKGPEKGTVDKSSTPAEGSAVAPGSTITYSVTVKNTGSVELTNKPVVDTLPSFVTVSGTPSDGGVVSADGRKITWTVTLAPNAGKTFTYVGLVATSVPAGTLLVNEVTFLDHKDTTSHPVGSSGLKVDKAVSPTGAARFGATLTYTLTVTATGNLPQSTVTVTDEIPAGTTYVVGSVRCPDSGTCAPTVSSGVVTWNLGSMQPGAVRTVSFQVTIDTPAAASDGSIPAVEIRNSGAARSDQVLPTTSNEVRTPVIAVQGVKTGQPSSGGGAPGSSPGTSTPGSGTPDTGVEDSASGPGVLAATGSGIPVGTMVALAGMLLLMGAALLRLAAGASRP